MLAKTKILTISNDQVLVNFLQKELGYGKYEVIATRHNGTQLREVINAEQPAFIILDIMMPTLDGIGICLQLRQWTQLPIMMLSTWDTGDGTVRGLNLGAESYLTDPFDVYTLKRRIEETLERNAAAMIDPLSSIHTFTN